jgi:hypothetical protein
MTASLQGRITKLAASTILQVRITRIAASTTGEDYQDRCIC